MGAIFSDTADNDEVREQADEILEEPASTAAEATPVGPRRRRRQTHHRSRAARRKTSRRGAMAGMTAVSAY
jgi:hypothetical protein